MSKAESVEEESASKETHTVSVKLYPEELDILDAKCELSGDDRSTCFRRAVLGDQMVDRAKITRRRAAKLTPKQAEVKESVVVQAWLARQLELLWQSAGRETNSARRLVRLWSLERLEGLIEALGLLNYEESDDDTLSASGEDQSKQGGDDVS